MCGRFVLMHDVSEVVDEFAIDEVHWNFAPSYNIAPGQDVAGVIKDDKKFLVKFRWGLVPFWSDDPSSGIVNARGETVHQKKSFARPFRKRRCLIVADGFYEWYEVGDKKIPRYFFLDSKKIFGFAGIYELWKKEGKTMATCTIITTDANEEVKPYHHRMPVIIEDSKRDIWLDKSIQEPEQLLPLVESYDAEEMHSYDVSQKVNNYKFNGPDCIEPAGSGG